ncbi:MAG: hypothetical protein PVJ67_05325 [Candidatus Pacearchaeota archaeon]|jgi:hypothetical protein
MSLIKNKKGGDKVISVYWFAILFIVAGGIVYMAALFYGGKYDVREIEAEILIDKVADCLNHGGELIDDWALFSEENFFEKCNLNFNVEDTNGWQEDQIFVKIDFENFEDKNTIKSISIGNENLEGFRDKGLICVERNLYSIKNKEQYIVKIKSIIRKTEKNE